MPTILVDPQAPDPAAVARAAALLRAGELVAFPTETVYGLGAHALDPAAVRRIFEAKGRPSYNPLIVHVADADAARALVTAWPEAAARAAAHFWPGPLTLVLPKRPEVPDEVTAGLPSVALRVPAHPVALALLREARIPIAAPSANRFTALSPTRASHVERALGDRVALILDGGPTSVGIESTVVDLRGARPVLLRPGVLDEQALAAVLGPLVLPPTSAAPTDSRPSPGMLDRHYAPRATMLLAEPGDAAAMARVRDRVHEARARGARTGLIRHSALAIGADVVVELPAEPAGYARRLYAALHELDDAGCELVVVESVPDEPSWAGVRDRLRRGATT